MKSFKEYITESSLQRKMIQGTGGEPLDIPGTKVVYNDPEKQITAYHCVEPEGAYRTGSRTFWCTNTRRNSWAHSYLERGNMFMIKHGTKRYAFFDPKKHPRGIEELKDVENKEKKTFRYPEVLDHLRSLPHATAHIKASQWEKPSHEDVEKEIDDEIGPLR